MANDNLLTPSFIIYSNSATTTTTTTAPSITAGMSGGGGTDGPLLRTFMPKTLSFDKFLTKFQKKRLDFTIRSNHIMAFSSVPLNHDDDDDTFLPGGGSGGSGGGVGIVENEQQQDEDLIERNLRFSGVGRLYSSSKIPEPSQEAPHLEIIDRLNQSTVAVVGLGGVGSWAAEALCRSGVGHIVLIDMDDICISNTNRQLHALSSTVGKSKIHQMKLRLLDINPDCNVTTIFDFISVDNVYSILDSIQPNLSVCLDAIDGQNEKTALLAACATQGIPIVTCGGAAGRSDPTQIMVDDITKAKEDRLLFRVRKQLRQFHGYPKGPKSGQYNKHRVKKWNIMSVFSMELPKEIDTTQVAATGTMRQCDGAMGTACFVTGTYGFVAASCVVNMIARNEFVVPVRPPIHWVDGYIHRNPNKIK